MSKEQCFWCGSRATHFDHFRCWEEDSAGNSIQVTSEAQATELGVTINEAEFWCDVCEGYFGFSYTPDEDESEGK
ncbi:MAG: hypothetical protein K8L99_07990 [Anaerolineae bacterium]|nr:hypothetical protein [Anaerolineae bacterium]